MKRFRILIPGLAFLLFIASSAFSQLSKVDINAMQEKINAEGWSFEVGENEATQYPLDQLAGLKMPENWAEMAQFDPMTSATASLPNKFDWRTVITGGLPPIRNQGGCGSCWAFGSIGALECAIKIKDGVTVDLSEQWMVSCNTDGYDCSGGWWVHKYYCNTPDACGTLPVGAVYESSYPYRAQNLPCNCPYTHDYRIQSWGYVGQQFSTPTIQQLKQAIYTYGPISVGVAADNYFQAYRRGIFTGTSTTVNHAVVLVGWDDTQGTNGIWILRNSWGSTNWGESGYMRIAYGASMVGYNASYIKYNGRVSINADSIMGPAPLPVNFSLSTTLPVDSCTWSFGDGTQSHEQAPTHTYEAPGEYPVSSNVYCSGKLYAVTYENDICIYADTVKGVKTFAKKNQKIKINLSVRNSLSLDTMIIPFSWDGPFLLKYDSSSTVGLRTSTYSTSFLNIDPNYYRRAVFLVRPNTGQISFPAGDGPILSMYFTVISGSSGTSNPITIAPYVNGYSIYDLRFVNSSGVYTPAVINPIVEYCSMGDINNDGEGPDIADMSFLVSYLTGSIETLPNLLMSNIDGDSEGVIDISDLSSLANYLSLGSPIPTCH
jgi:C1A family cysteine protease